MLANFYQKNIIEKPKLIFILLLICLVSFGYYSKNFKLDASSETLLLEGDPDLEYLNNNKTGRRGIRSLIYHKQGRSYKKIKEARLSPGHHKRPQLPATATRGNARGRPSIGAPAMSSMMRYKRSVPPQHAAYALGRFRGARARSLLCP